MVGGSYSWWGAPPVMVGGSYSWWGAPCIHAEHELLLCLLVVVISAALLQPPPPTRIPPPNPSPIEGQSGAPVPPRVAPNPQQPAVTSRGVRWEPTSALGGVCCWDPLGTL